MAEQRCAELAAQVASLEAKLHALHSTDASALRRNAASAAQHIAAARLELEEAAALARDVGTTGDYGAGLRAAAVHSGAAAAAAGVAFAAARVLEAPRPVRQAPLLLAGAAIAARLAVEAVARAFAVASADRRRRKELAKLLAALADRLDILAVVAAPPPASADTKAPDDTVVVVTP